MTIPRVSGALFSQLTESVRMAEERKTLNVLVLGVGGNVSQGILKALHKGALSCRVVGASVVR